MRRHTRGPPGHIVFAITSFTTHRGPLSHASSHSRPAGPHRLRDHFLHDPSRPAETSLSSRSLSFATTRRPTDHIAIAHHLVRDHHTPLGHIVIAHHLHRDAVRKISRVHLCFCLTRFGAR